MAFFTKTAFLDDFPVCPQSPPKEKQIWFFLSSRRLWLSQGPKALHNSFGYVKQYITYPQAASCYDDNSLGVFLRNSKGILSQKFLGKKDFSVEFRERNVWGKSKIYSCSGGNSEVSKRGLADRGVGARRSFLCQSFRPLFFWTNSGELFFFQCFEPCWSPTPSTANPFPNQDSFNRT